MEGLLFYRYVKLQELMKNMFMRCDLVTSILYLIFTDPTYTFTHKKNIFFSMSLFRIMIHNAYQPTNKKKYIKYTTFYQHKYFFVLNNYEEINYITCFV